MEFDLINAVLAIHNTLKADGIPEYEHLILLVFIGLGIYGNKILHKLREEGT